MRYLFVLLLLGACATPEEERADYLSTLSDRCSAYGMKPDTAEFRQCMMSLDLANQKANNDAANLLLLQEATRGLNQPPIFVQPQPQTSTLTNCVQRGNRMECKSF